MAMEQSCYIQCMLPTAGLNEKNMCLKRSMNILLLKRRSISVIMKATTYFLKEPEVWFSTETTGWFLPVFHPGQIRKVLDEFCEKMNYEPVVFHSVDETGQPIYHTNVMMCIADKYVVICLDSIRDVEEKNKVIAAIQKTGKEMIDITYEQLNHFAGNMLQIENSKGEKLLVMSTQAFQSLSKEQVQKLEGYNRIIHAPLNTIEVNGGGSARCMMAEVHLPYLS